MVWILILLGTVVISGAFIFVGGRAPAGAVLVVGLVLAGTQKVGLDPIGRLRPINFDWRSGAPSAVYLFVVGAIYDMVLVFDRGDNAYVLSVLLGWMSYFLGAVFGLSAASGRAFRVGLYWVGLMLVCVIGALFATMFVLALAIIPSQGYPDNSPLISHFMSLLLLFPTLFVGYYLPHKDWSSTAEQPTA